VLREIDSVRQDDPGLARRWFQDDFFDLFVWMRADGSVMAFQLCYDRLGEERVLGWSEGRGFMHKGIDDGEATPLKNRSPILVANGPLAAGLVEREFRASCQALDAGLAAFVLSRVAEAGACRNGGASGPRA
jgi:hypothetical protein